MSCSDKPPPSSVACGETQEGVTCDGDAWSVTGTSCPDGNVCTEQGCAEERVLLTADPGNVVVEEGGAFRISVTANLSHGSLVLQTSGMSVSTMRTDDAWVVGGVARTTGEYTLTLTAIRTDGRVMGATTIDVTVTCNHENECCTPGTTGYDEGAPCNANNHPGVCTATGDCVENCQPTGSTACRGDEIWTLDTCGRYAELVEECDEACVENNGAQCAEQPPACNETYTYTCRGQEGWRTDESCGLSELVVTCNDDEECVVDDGVHCVPTGPCSTDELYCSGRCVNPLTSRTDCGGCGRVCNQDEQCVQGTCQPIPGCVVVCDTNEDCGEGEVCLAGGSCTESRCAAVQPLTVENVTVLTEELSEGLVRVTATQLPEGVHYNLANLATSPLENVTAR